MIETGSREPGLATIAWIPAGGRQADLTDQQRRMTWICTAISAMLWLAACQPAPGTVVVTPAPTSGPTQVAPAASPAASPAAQPATSPVPAAALPSPPPSPAASPSPVACQFQLGFKELRDLAGASTVGDCLEAERPIAGNGNVEQRTTNGLLVYRAI